MCDRCSLPGAHLLAGDCVRALRRRLTEQKATTERWKLRAEAETRAAMANRRELLRLKKLHGKATAGYEQLMDTISAIREMATK